MKVSRMEFRMLIDGELIDESEHIAVENPATGLPFAEAPDCSRATFERAVAAAARTFPEWRRDVEARAAVLRACADVAEANTAEIAELLTLEQGKPLTESAGEVALLIRRLRSFAEMRLEPEVVRDDPERRVTIRWEPLGVAGLIAPWNAPVAAISSKVAPALAAGNTVIFKPSPFTPLSTLRIAELWRDVVPRGVLNVVSGGDHLGPWITGDPTIRKISMTGSVATGVRVAQSAAVTLKRVTLELGGNDPAIVLDDVDVDDVASTIFTKAYRNCGQICIAVKRVYVPRALHDDFVEVLAGKVREVVVGDGLDPATHMGPLANAPQLERVRGLVAEARLNGCDVLDGASLPDAGGYFHAPSLVVGARDGMAIVDQEQFGPALPIVAYDDVSTIAPLTGREQYGLGASVWSADPERARSVATGITAGTTWINSHLLIDELQPFGGANMSGVGFENGRYGLRAYAEQRVLNEAVA
jgi:acyl-CoA reductase-like NAD-dependent aldehyde dehydrogenase